MLEKITNFIRTFFEIIFRDLRKLFSPKKKEEIVIVPPDPEDLEPQDGAEIPQDTIITVDTNLEEVVIVPEPNEPPPPEIPPIDNEPEPITSPDPEPKPETTVFMVLR